MYKIFKGFATVAICDTIDEVKAALATVEGSVINVIKTGKKKNRVVYSAYHFQAGEVAGGWA